MEGSQLCLQSVWKVCSSLHLRLNYFTTLEYHTRLFTGMAGGVAHTDSRRLKNVGLVNGAVFAPVSVFAPSTLIRVVF